MLVSVVPHPVNPCRHTSVTQSPGNEEHPPARPVRQNSTKPKINRNPIQPTLQKRIVVCIQKVVNFFFVPYTQCITSCCVRILFRWSYCRLPMQITVTLNPDINVDVLRPINPNCMCVCMHIHVREHYIYMLLKYWFVVYLTTLFSN
jgi:hypothetical protein